MSWTASYRQLGPADLLDIMLVALVLFVLLYWMLLHVSPRGLALLALLVALYVVARVLDLDLARAVVLSLLGLMALLGMIVYQSEIRRSLDRVMRRASSGTTTSRAEQLDSFDMLADAISRMADKRLGALIAIRGHEPWSRSVHGGIRLEGCISGPLLESIFSTQSPGHDGAVLIEGNRIVEFAAHLPLSTNLAEVGEHGTRHAAALGLSEVCDALVIVVSEEHGTISVAHEGAIQRIAPAGLKARLEAFWRHPDGETPGRHPARRRGAWIAAALLAAVLAAAGWWFWGG